MNVIESNADVIVNDVIAKANSKATGIVSDASAKGDAAILSAEVLNYFKLFSIFYRLKDIRFF